MRRRKRISSPDERNRRPGGGGISPAALKAVKGDGGEMRTLSIDIETFSDLDLKKCGVYRYAENPGFDILLFGFSVDGGAVRVVDLACGEKIPDEVVAALSDASVTKWAFNAMFERVCLSNYLGDWLEPEGWHCTMVWSATLGLPLSLEGVGAALGLEKQKLTEGKDLIRYYCVPCKPTKANGGRTRNLPEHDREKWERFKAYNLRDVEVEMQIQQKLSKFPVPEKVWEEYCQDQEINVRGIGVDMELVRQAIAMDEHSRGELAAAMQKLTGVEIPNSVQQMKQWLAEHGLETDTLGKKRLFGRYNLFAYSFCDSMGAKWNEWAYGTLIQILLSIVFLVLISIIEKRVSK